MRDKALIKPWDKCVDKILFLWANFTCCVFHGIEEQHEGHAEVQRHVEEVVPKFDIGRRSEEEENTYGSNVILVNCGFMCCCYCNGDACSLPKAPNCTKRIGTTNRIGAHNTYS